MDLACQPFIYNVVSAGWMLSDITNNPRGLFIRLRWIAGWVCSTTVWKSRASWLSMTSMWRTMTSTSQFTVNGLNWQKYNLESSNIRLWMGHVGMFFLISLSLSLPIFIKKIMGYRFIKFVWNSHTNFSTVTLLTEFMWYIVKYSTRNDNVRAQFTHRFFKVPPPIKMQNGIKFLEMTPLRIQYFINYAF